jgi:hypothetical protein
VTRQHKWLCAGGPATRQHKGPSLLAQSCWRVQRPSAKTGFSREDKSFLAQKKIEVMHEDDGCTVTSSTVKT